VSHQRIKAVIEKTKPVMDWKDVFWIEKIDKNMLGR